MTTPNEGNTHDHEACVRLFTDTMARLDEINERRLRFIVNIAREAAEAANSIAPSDTNADQFVEKVTALIEDLKSSAASREGEMGGGGGAPKRAPSAEGDKFCETIERDINMAIENSLSLQQQLNVTSVAVLTQGAALILNAGKNDQN